MRWRHDHDLHRAFLVRRLQPVRPTLPLPVRALPLQALLPEMPAHTRGRTAMTEPTYDDFYPPNPLTGLTQAEEAEYAQYFTTTKEND